MLRDKRVQLAVEGRFCDSAISVREAALELVGRHIASHPDVGLQVCEIELRKFLHFLFIASAFSLPSIQNFGVCDIQKFWWCSSILRRLLRG